MASPRAAALYSPELLALAVELAEVPYDDRARAIGHARSRSCGSVIDLSSSNAERIETVGLRVSACAVGQASAAIFAREAAGMDAAAVETTIEELGEWLEGRAPSAILPRLELLEAARPHRGRHEAILLPWRAALAALSNPGTPG